MLFTLNALDTIYILFVDFIFFSNRRKIKQKDERN